MRQFLMRLSTIEGQDEDEQRRAHMVFIVALGLIITSLVLVVFALAYNTGNTNGWMVPLFNSLLMLSACVVLRWGLVNIGAWIIIFTLILGCIVPMYIDSAVSISLFYAALSLLFASLTLRPWQIWLVLVLMLGLVATTLYILPPSAYEHRDRQIILFGSLIFFGIVALLSYLGANNTAHSFQTIRQARQQVEESLIKLEQSNAVLEQRITERTSSLQKALSEVELRAEEQARLLSENEQQRTIIREMSVPVIPVSDTVMIMPLIGELDELRLQYLQQQALKALEHYKMRFLVLDITAVPFVDSQVAQGLLSVMQSSRLLGTDVILVGIRPEVAQTVVQLGLNLAGIRSFGSLQSALAEIYMPYQQFVRTNTTITI